MASGWGSVDGSDIIRNGNIIENLQNPGGIEDKSWIKDSASETQVDKTVTELVNGRLKSFRYYSGDSLT